MKQNRLTWTTAAAGAIAALACGTNAPAQSVDSLLDKLVQKGVLTTKEAKELKEESDKDFTKAYQAKSGMPDWVTSLKLGGDFRARYEGFFSENPNLTERDRFRYRVRFGAVASLMDNFEIGLRLSSADAPTGFSTGNPLSGNSTLQDNGTRKLIGVDLAYAKWYAFNLPSANGSMTFGKMENPFTFSYNVFDPDYNPEGFAAQTAYLFSDQHVLKGTFAGFMLDELANDVHDPFLVGAQVMLDSKWSPQLATSVGGGFLGITSVQSLNNVNVPNINRGNTRNAAGAPAYHFNPLIADASLTYTLESFPLYSGAFPIKPLGEFLYNPATSTKNEAFVAGIQFGKAGKKGLWEVGYQYRYLGANSWYEELADDDFGAFYQTAQPNSGFAGGGYGGGTNVRGHVAKLSYSPFDSLTFSLTYYNTILIDKSPPGSKSGMSHLMVDATWKF